MSCISVSRRCHLSLAQRSCSHRYFHYSAGQFRDPQPVFLPSLRVLTTYRYLLSLLGFNIARHTLELYFGQSWR